MVLKDTEIKDEAELEALIKSNPEQIEKGLAVIDSQLSIPPTNRRIDLLCVDSEGFLTIIELKADSDEHQMEQIMMYYDWAVSNLDWIKNAYKEYDIEDEPPRLILVAKSFPHPVKTLAKYITDNIAKTDLYRYKSVKTGGKKKEIVCYDVSLPAPPEISEKPKTAEEIVGYIRKKKVENECNEVREYIKDNLPKCEEDPKRGNVTYKYKGRNICAISPRRDYFQLEWRETDGEWKTRNNITTLEEAKKIIDKEIKEFYNHLKENR